MLTSAMVPFPLPSLTCALSQAFVSHSKGAGQFTLPAGSWRADRGLIRKCINGDEIPKHPGGRGRVLGTPWSLSGAPRVLERDLGQGRKKEKWL